MILITGATGTNGREIVKELQGLGAPCRALVRDPAKAVDLKSAGAALVAGTFDDPASVKSAMEGCERAMILVPTSQKMGEYAKTAIDAANAADVKHIVYLSAVGANPATGTSFFTKTHGASEKVLQASGLAWTILRPNFLMKNLLMSAGTIKSQNAYFDCWNNGKAAWVDARDIAAVAARCLARAGHEGKIYPITGPAVFGGAEVCGLLARVLGRPIQYMSVPRDGYQQALLGAGLPEWQAKAVTDLDGVVLDGQAAELSETVGAVTGRPARGMEQFIRDNAAAFKN